MRKTRNIAIAFSVVVIILLGLHAEVITVPVMAQEPQPTTQVTNVLFQRMPGSLVEANVNAVFI